jgi:hypothetical protein
LATALDGESGYPKAAFLHGVLFGFLVSVCPNRNRSRQALPIQNPDSEDFVPPFSQHFPDGKQAENRQLGPGYLFYYFSLMSF